MDSFWVVKEHAADRVNDLLAALNMGGHPTGLGSNLWNAWYVEGTVQDAKLEGGEVIAYEYIRLPFDMGDLTALNSLSGVGWRVASVQPKSEHEYWALLERQLPSTDGRVPGALR